MNRTTCSACGCGDLDKFLDLGPSPIADAYTSDPAELSPMHPLQVAVCGKCRLVQLLEVVDADILFGTGYSFYSSASPPLSAYHAAYAHDILAHHRGLADRGVIEVGCNDGDMLRHFAGFPHLGVDPAAGPAGVCELRGLDVMIRPFGLAVAHEIRDRRGRQGIVIANHVLAHVADVADVLAGIGALLADDGVAFVEVQYLPDLLVNNAFDLVYHEHRNFFSLSSLEQAAVRHDLHVVDVELTNRQGGSVRVTLRRRPAPTAAVDWVRQSEQWLKPWDAYDGMQGRVERIRTRLIDMLDTYPAGSVIGYGAPAKATTLLNFCHLDRRHLAYVVDTTVAKQGRWIPGTGIHIVAPSTFEETIGLSWAPKGVLMLAWNYAGQIMRRRPNDHYVGDWIVPIPAPVVY